MVKKLEQLLQEYKTDISLNFLNENHLSESLQKTKKEFYSEEESTAIYEYINIFQTKLFQTQMEVCEVVQNYVYVSRYNLKRNQLNKKDGLTFVCSCISKKPVQKRPEEREEAKMSLSLMNSFEFNSGRNENNCVNYTLTYHNRSKRHNEEACKYRLRFKYDGLRKGYWFVKQSNLNHNHFPEEAEDFKGLYRNIKFPLDLVLYVFKEMINAQAGECVLSKKDIELLRNNCCLHYNFLSEAKEKYKSTISKKFNYFMNITKIKLERSTKEDNGLLSLKDKLLFVLLEFFLKKSSGSYLEFQDTQALKELFDSK